jgi:CRISPR/Cas system-associated endonuclease/helicase Cas3
MLVIFYHLAAAEKLSLLEDSFTMLQAHADRIHSAKAQNDLALKQMQVADASYLNEPLRFLEGELRRLQTVLRDDPNLQRRYDYLSTDNQLSFLQESSKSGDLFNEYRLKLKHPVDLDAEDLKKVLTLIEGVSTNLYSPKKGRPLMIVTDFKLVRKKSPLQEEIYEVDLKLLRRGLS